MEDLNKPFEERKKTVLQIIQEDHDKLERMEGQLDEMSDNIAKIQEQIKMWKTMAWVVGGVATILGWVVSQIIDAWGK